MELQPGTPRDPREETWWKDYEKLGDRSIDSLETNPGGGKSYSGGFDFDSAETGAGRSYYDFDSLETNPGFDSAKTGTGRGGLPTIDNMIKDAKRNAAIAPVLKSNPKQAAANMVKTAKVPPKAFKGLVAVDVALYAKQVYDIVNNEKISLRQQETALWSLAEDAAKEAALATGAAALGPPGWAAYGTYVVAKALAQMPGRSFETKDASGRTIDLHGGERETYPMRGFRTYEESKKGKNMKLTKSYLKQLIKEEAGAIVEGDELRQNLKRRFPKTYKMMIELYALEAEAKDWSQRFYDKRTNDYVKIRRQIRVMGKVPMGQIASSALAKTAGGDLDSLLEAPKLAMKRFSRSIRSLAGELKRGDTRGETSDLISSPQRMTRYFFKIIPEETRDTLKDLKKDEEHIRAGAEQILKKLKEIENSPEMDQYLMKGSIMDRVTKKAKRYADPKSQPLLELK